MNRYCCRCGKQVVKPGTRPRGRPKKDAPPVPPVPCEGAELVLRQGQAPRVKCPCGEVQILLRGSL